MQLEVDFEVFKALTAFRESESDSYNAVLRRLLGLPNHLNALEHVSRGSVSGPVNDLAEGQNYPRPKGLFGSVLGSPVPTGGGVNALARLMSGLWFSNVHFPNGTKFRATYKGQTHFAEIVDGQWVGMDGKVRSSPSDAASAISNTNVNGWRFWLVQRPDDPSWRKLEELRS